jgi:hypothetical protein
VQEEQELLGELVISELPAALLHSDLFLSLAAVVEIQLKIAL